MLKDAENGGLRWLLGDDGDEEGTASQEVYGHLLGAKGRVSCLPHQRTLSSPQHHFDHPAFLQLL